MRGVTSDQLQDIAERVDSGMTPDDVANYYGRIADLDLGDIAVIRDVALAVQRGEPVTPIDGEPAGGQR